MRCFCTKIRTHHCKVVLLDEQELIQEIQMLNYKWQSFAIFETGWERFFVNRNVQKKLTEKSFYGGINFVIDFGCLAIDKIVFDDLMRLSDEEED
ncbi:hypothetical protein LSTR_LSTR007266 [Laodelphax striatellus]|uniref:Uncharacterized protein n=1 Tax=Laodelphax striatellus TaxID=195883 RepID=A0A482XDP0_LAOST|nr:hypothetical protein LSTR_LSTR007266 [Laodelphax striatellus]